MEAAAPTPVDGEQPVAPSSSSGTRKASNVYSRLSDPKSYTGVYRKRFESDCHDLTESVVHDLSNTMRTNLNYDVSPPRAKRAPTPRASTTSSHPTSSVPAPAPVQQAVELSSSAALSPEKLQGDPNDPHTLLKAVFHYYCRFGRTGAKGLGEKTLDNANFVKLCRDCPDLLGGAFGKTDVDLIFIKAKKKGERRINYARFLDALGMIAIQKYGDMPLEASVPKLLETHIALLPCLLEFTDGRTVQAVWQKRAEREEPSAGGDVPQPPAAVDTASPPSPPSPTARIFQSAGDEANDTAQAEAEALSPEPPETEVATEADMGTQS